MESWQQEANAQSAIETELERLLPWSAAKEVHTKNGPRFLRKASPSEAFWAAWRAGKERLRAVGISCGRSQLDNEWEVCWWRKLPPALVAQREEAVEQSRATDAEISVPCPDGLAYMPFQRAGIRFAIRLFGVETSTKEGGNKGPFRCDAKGVLIADEMGL